jgi:hypothetical protein
MGKGKKKRGIIKQNFKRLLDLGYAKYDVLSVMKNLIPFLFALPVKVAFVTAVVRNIPMNGQKNK